MAANNPHPFKAPSKVDYNDLGFGTRVSGNERRLVNADGSFNVVRTGLSWVSRFSPYHWLLSMPWPRFYSMLLSWYIGINVLFAGLYLASGTHALHGSEASTFTERFLECFFFSAQTFTTVGYGRLSPESLAANFIASLEGMIGLLSFALATGLLYGRFARPRANILFSGRMVIAPYQQTEAGLMFRLANARDNQLIEVMVQLVFSFTALDKNHVRKRYFKELKLERETINFFPTSWTVVHPITSESPLHGHTAADLEEADAEFLILVRAFDDTFSSTVHARHSYKHHEIAWGARFTNIHESLEDGRTAVAMNRLSEIEVAEGLLQQLPQLQELER